eukprot:4901078-Lingulodinium_polyedra.AAC.1
MSLRSPNFAEKGRTATSLIAYSPHGYARALHALLFRSWGTLTSPIFSSSIGPGGAARLMTS